MEVLIRRAAELGLSVSSATTRRIWTYFQLLERWNARINLTGFRLGTENQAAIDRLLIEPMLAAAYAVPANRMLDVGSGGGSPAIPLALALTPSPALTMVESRQRKTAFLREALRTTGLAGVAHATRFQDFAADPSVRGMFDLVTVRAVRLDGDLLDAIARVLRPAGQLLHLHEPGLTRDATPEIRWAASEALLPASNSHITVGTRLPDDECVSRGT